jgi:hypothetical protein
MTKKQKSQIEKRFKNAYGMYKEKEHDDDYLAYQSYYDGVYDTLKDLGYNSEDMNRLKNEIMEVEESHLFYLFEKLNDKINQKLGTNEVRLFEYKRFFSVIDNSFDGSVLAEFMSMLNDIRTEINKISERKEILKAKIDKLTM